MQDYQSAKRKIFVTHSGRQYVHQLLNALQLNNIPFQFFTSFAFKPAAFPFNLLKILPKKIGSKIEKEFRKRSFSPVGDKHISSFPFFELLREITDKIFKNRIAESMLFYRDRIHDAWAAAQITSDYAMVIGYEECSVRTFRAAKKKGLTTILDLAQIHYKEIENISKEFPVFSEIYKNQSLRGQINAIKEEEIQLADFIICLSEFAKASLVKNGYPAHRIYVVSLGFDPGKFSPKANYAASAKLKLVYAGTITKRKGVDLLLRLTNDLNKYVDLTMIGPMADAGELVGQYKGRFIWHPYLEQEEMNSVLKKGDVFVFPSYLDSWAMVVIEAMACGLPVIISENTGAKDAVKEEAGFIVPAGNYQALRDKVMYFYENRERIASMGNSARLAAQTFTWQSYHQQLVQILGEINTTVSKNIAPIAPYESK